MAMFYYDPKYKNTLPYYDRVPLVLPVDTIKGGFVGLNFHYLLYALRYRLLQNLQGYATNDKFNRTTRLDVDYSNIAGEGLVKPAIKKYLYAHVRSRFLRIDADEMAIAINLPVADFQGASLGSVFSKSRNDLMAILRGGRRIGNFDIRLGILRDRSLDNVDLRDARLKRKIG